MRALSLPVLLLLSACGSVGTGAPDAGDAGCDGPARTPQNLVKNPGFECGGDVPAEYAPQFGDFLVAAGDAHGGARAARLTANANASGQFAYADAVVTAPAPTTYCATAWVKGTVPVVRYSLLVDVGGGGTEYTFNSPVATASWLRLPPSTNLQVPATAGAKVYLRFQMRDARAGDTLFVDDLDVWVSADGRCQEPR